MIMGLRGGRSPQTARRPRPQIRRLGERPHYCVFGGPWNYDSPGRGEPTGEDRAWLEQNLAANGAVNTGRGTYEAAGHWGDVNC